MRLTLRTLLAYSDDILDPADHEELGKKIEASDFASELIHRARDTVRRLRLGAPDVLADGGDGVLDTICVSDANAVAEYLDNTMASEDVADFERTCLEIGNEADMHLAEVASCHHVLTMVLGEPAEIGTDVRRRMYELSADLVAGKKLRIEPAHVPPQQSVAAPVAPPEVQLPDPSETEVPDYLLEAARANGRGKRRLLIATLLLIAGAVGYFAFSPVEQPSAPAEIAMEDLAGIEGELEIGGSDVGVNSPTGVVAGKEGEAPPFKTDTETAGTEAPAFNSNAGVDSLDLTVEIPKVAVDNTETTSNVTTGPTQESELPEVTEPVTPADEIEGNESEIADGSSRIASTAGSRSSVSGDTQETAAKSASPVQLGSYLGNNDVLLRHDDASNQWIRLPPRSAILTGDRLLTLPTFRTHVVLADVNTYLSGGTQVVLAVEGETSEKEEVDLRLGIAYGKLLLNAGLNGSQIEFHVGEDQHSFRLSGSTSLAVEVRRIFVPGNDNENQSSPVEAVWYLTSGSVDWSGMSGETRSIEAPATWKTVDGIDDLPRAIEDLPEWIDREPMTDTQRRARTSLIDELEPGMPVRLRLLELSDQDEKGRKREVRTLASEASVYIGEFEPFAKALSDKDQKRAWRTHITALRQALALSPHAAAGVREAFVNLRGEAAGGDLMEMVAGYSQDQIGRTREAYQDGAVSKLIRWLENDSLDYRVLAIHNLNDIKGVEGPASLKGFRPDGPLRQRKISIAKIWEGFESNEFFPSR